MTECPPDFKPWRHYEMSAIKVLDLGGDSKAICYVVKANRGEVDFDALISSVWRRGGPWGWEMVLHQQTPV